MPPVVATPAQIDETISRLHYVFYGTPASPEDFANIRPLLANNYVEGMMQLLQNALNDPNSLLGKSKQGSATVNKQTVIDYISKNLN